MGPEGRAGSPAFAAMASLGGLPLVSSALRPPQDAARSRHAVPSRAVQITPQSPQTVAGYRAHTASAPATLAKGRSGQTGHGQGSMPALATHAEREQALRDVEAGFYAESSAAAMKAIRRCVKLVLSRWGLAPYLTTADKLNCLGVGLKAGAYRSAPSIPSQ